MTPPTPSAAPPSRSRRWVVLLLILVVGAGIAFAAWRYFRPDPDGAVRANNRGVGHMEQFAYVPAGAAFEEAVRLAPDWLPPRVNLGIALLNQAQDNPQALPRAQAVFREVLKKDADNPHAHYCLGIIAFYQGRLGEAYPEFQAVNRIDPDDAFTWYHLGLSHPDGDDSPAARECFERALRLDPYLNAARLAVAQSVGPEDPQRRKVLLGEFQKLKDAKQETLYKIAYTEMGPYADVIGRPETPKGPPPAGPLPAFERAELFRAELAAGARWATAADLGQGALGDLRRAVRSRFGGTMVLLDYDRDGRPDVFLLGAVVEGGRLRNLLLHNEGGGRFTDATAAAGLDRADADLGCAAADFNNDELPDLLITGADGVRLFRNAGGSKFEDVTAAARLDRLKGVYLGACWLDVDQDGDLDLVLACYADNPEAALSGLRGDGGPGCGVVLFLNVGEAPPALPDENQKPLTVAFRAHDPDGLVPSGPFISFVASDVDADRDVDFVLLADNAAPAVVLNDRLLRFHRAEGSIAPAARWNGGLVLDADRDGRFDLFLVAADNSPSLLLGRRAKPGSKPADWFAAGETNAPALAQAQAVDVDLDGWTDVVGLSSDRQAVLLHNEGGGKLTHKPDAFGGDLPADLWAVAAADIDGDCAPDLLLWSEAEGLQLRRSRGNGHRAVRLELTGLRKSGKSLRTNADGIGCVVIVQAGRVWPSVENTTLTAGLGQSRLPLLLGIGRNDKPEAVRIFWPDGMPQAELEISACELARISEANRKIVSCPALLVWDGRRFDFVTDFLGAGSMGELAGDGSVRPPRPEESVKIEPGRMVPKDGQYFIKIAEPMDEVLYLDRLQLLVIDHPAGVSVYPDERFAISGPPPSQELLVFKERTFPVRARDHRGTDVTELVRTRDRRAVDGFAVRSWLGYAEEHALELDFGERGPAAKGERLFLCLAGWTEYPYPESIYAATQAGVPLLTPVLEQRGDDGTWHRLGELGFPAGLPRVMTREVTGLLRPAKRCVLRIRTNMQVYWDQVYLAPLAENPAPDKPGKVRVTPLGVAGADLRHRGFMKEVLPGGKGPVGYDDSQTERVEVTRWRGRFTRTGDVTELLRADDDRFVLCGPGDEIIARFDAKSLPPLPDGWERSFVLKTWGYCKDPSPFTRTGGQVEPLPFRGMGDYAAEPAAQQAADAAREEYRRRWNTRPPGGR